MVTKEHGRRFIGDATKGVAAQPRSHPCALRRAFTDTEIEFRCFLRVKKCGFVEIEIGGEFETNSLDNFYDLTKGYAIMSVPIFFYPWPLTYLSLLLTVFQNWTSRRAAAGP